MSTEAAVTPELLRAWRLPAVDGSKYERGQLVVAGGAASSPGAAMLAGEAALRVGAGRLSLAVARSVATQVATAFRESATIPLTGDHEEYRRADAVLIGPGLDDARSAVRLVESVIPLLRPDATLILDAFALGVIPRLRTLDRVAGRLILTPNREEAEILAPGGDLARIARLHGAVVTCFGAIAEPGGRRWRVELPAGGLGTSGSGDVLAGAIAGLAARGAAPDQAAVWGTYLHVRAGQLAGDPGYLAGDILTRLPAAMRELA